MFSTLAAAIAHNVTLAGDDFSWSAVRGTSRPAGGTDMQGYRVWLWKQQEGLCAACGESLAITEGEVAHVVSNHGSPSKGRGYVAGNAYMSHDTCNADDWDVFGAIVPADSFVRGDLVPLTYPSRKVMRAEAETFAGAVNSRMASERERRLAARLSRTGQAIA